MIETSQITYKMLFVKYIPIAAKESLHLSTFIILYVTIALGYIGDQYSDITEESVWKWNNTI